MPKSAKLAIEAAPPNFKPNTLFLGDNLPVLRGMNSDVVDLIYLDPPFNSKRQYAGTIGTDAERATFDDTWRWDSLDERWLGEIDRRCPALSAVVHAAKLTQGDGTAAYLAFMGVRLLELNRVLKSSGSIWLHCDGTASHYLKAAMDAVFGKANFRNEVIWRRTNAHPLSLRKFEAVTDSLLYFAKSGDFLFHGDRTPMSQAQLAALFTRHDERGRYTTTDLTGGKAGGKEAYKPFKGVKPSAGRAWAPPVLAKLPQWAREALGDGYAELDQLAKCHALDRIGLIYWTKQGRPRFKRYADAAPAQPVPNLWNDIKPASGDERTGWATQKPLALLQRIIKASSNAGDLVLDPFAGCATCCVASAMEGRRWVGIEACEAASEIVEVRLSEAVGGDLAAASEHYKANVRRCPPKRTDLTGDELKRNTRAYRTQENIDYLYGQQRGDCAGCGNHYRAKDFAIDHIVPKSQGGPNTRDNLQLLCTHCNSTKGDDDMPTLRRRLAEQEAERQAALGI